MSWSTERLFRKANKNMSARLRRYHKTSTITFLAILVFSLRFYGATSGAGFHSNVNLELIRPSKDGSGFISAVSGNKFIVWGFNYDHDDAGRLIEDYWRKEWPTVVEDFKEMKVLGANTVRIHLQTAKFMQTPADPNQASLDQLARLVKLAEKTGLYLDITGLGCYHKKDVPDWYDKMDEAARWDVQTRFWEVVAETCAASPAIFCYDLMNEPILRENRSQKPGGISSSQPSESMTSGT
jgi:hypothetical protein